MHRPHSISPSVFDLAQRGSPSPNGAKPPSSDSVGCVGRTASHISWQRFSVPYEYPVAFTHNLFSADNPLLAEVLTLRETGKRHRCLVYVDAGLVEAQPGLIPRIEGYFTAHAACAELLATPIVVPGGECIKGDLDQVVAAQRTIHRLGVDRHSFVIAIGGGAVLDAIGLGAAMAHRGVRHIRVPTTVLSQNDSGVGVKNGINLSGIKNFIGAFAPPWAVLSDYDLLASLPRRDRIAGIAEAIKVALIRDREFFEWLETRSEALTRFEPAVEARMIRRSAELHMHQIAHGGDPFETGSGRPLDFGHWAAHKLETLTHHALRHGEAVAMGIALDTRYSVLSGLLPQGADERVVALLTALGLPVFHPQMLTRDDHGEVALLAGLREFREHLGGQLNVTLLATIGQGIETHHMDTNLVLDAIHWLQDCNARNRR